MDLNEIRAKYFDFFKEKGHEIIPSASLIPDNDATTLFTGSGMQPLMPYLLGDKHPMGVRLVNSQKCFRAEDIDEVGDNRHTTFFEMLGNWSLGDYFKEDQLKWFFEFLTDGVGLDPKNIYVTVFSGDQRYGIDADKESVGIWKKLFKKKGIDASDIELLSGENASKVGMGDGRIFYYDAKKNWWSRSGTPENMPAGEPGGPDSEVFYDFGTEHDESFGENCHPNCDCGRFVEIGNSVFMQFVKTESDKFVELPKKNIDFGGGLLRITAAKNGDPDVFKTSVFEPLIKIIEKKSNKLYDSPVHQKSFRIVADHLRGAVFMIGDQIIPSNTEAGYFVRRLIRRAVRHLDALYVNKNTLAELANPIIDTYQEQYTNLKTERENIISNIQNEEEKFRKTLERGLRKITKSKTEFTGVSDFQLTPEELFNLYQEDGFPVEMSLEEINKLRVKPLKSDVADVLIKEFNELMKKHRNQSRLGAEQKFKGGLANHDDVSVKYHTATHLLHQALKDVLGSHVNQKGSNITKDRLRFDFSHPAKLTPEEKSEVEKIVNEKIAEKIDVTYEDLSPAEAEKKGAIGLFEGKYGDVVRVYSIGDYSTEYCGGPHVANTSELGHFKIKKEESTSAGVRRIKAILE